MLFFTMMCTLYKVQEPLDVKGYRVKAQLMGICWEENDYP